MRRMALLLVGPGSSRAVAELSRPEAPPVNRAMAAWNSLDGPPGRVRLKVTRSTGDNGAPEKEMETP